MERTFWGESPGGAEEFMNCFLDPVGLERLEGVLRDLVMNLLSYHDVGRYPEAVYHAFVLGLPANLRNIYEIRSEPESGYGRADILMVPKTSEYPLGYVIEFKSLNEGEDFDAAESAAFEQIEAKDYASRLREAGVAPENIRQLAVLVKRRDVRVTVRGL